MVSLDVRPSGAGIDARSGPKRRPASNEVEHCSRAGRSAPPVEAVLSRSGGPKTPGPRFLDPLEGITGIRGPSVPPDRRPTAKSGPRKVDADEGDSIDMGDAATPATDGSTGPTGTAIVAPTLTLTARSTRETNGTWLLLTLASGVGSATGMVVESALMAGIGLTLMFACMLGLSTSLRRRRSDVARGSACRNAGAGCWQWRLGDGVAWHDERFQRLLGAPSRAGRISFSDLLGRIHPEDLAQFHFAVDAAIERADPIDFVVRMRTTDGDWRPIRFIGGLDRDASGPSGHLGGIALPVTDDVIAGALATRTGDELLSALSEQAKLARDLGRIRVDLEERNGELEVARTAAVHATRAKTEFLANMSHEIRTPLTAIIGYADLLAEEDTDPATRRSILQTVRGNGEHLLALVSEILDLSKIEAGRTETDRVPMDVRGCVRDVAESLRGQIDRKALEFDVVIDDDIHAAVSLDPLRFRQIVVNLLGNAIKFTAEGRITVELRSTDRDDRIRLIVSDTGIGMSDLEATRIFEPFQQADGSTTRRFGGTGLGLTISRRLCEMLGGDLEVRSTAGAGSTFTATVSAPPTAHRPDVRTRTQMPIGLRVLLAEDGLDNRRLITHLLSRLGARVHAVEDGAAAVKAVMDGTREPFDVVVMDMQMPVLDGYEAVRRIRNAGLDVPILALTANAMPGDRNICLEAGCDEYLPKPVRRDDLARSIAGLVNRVSRWRNAG
ncbi:MAG: hypothetical protein CMJ27_13945 [Phycisphaerae bacterium]|nr:hypothetical protein [Phycisphaerae bacterium]MAH67453.1 hypothetical protein [Phycisphaerae bacterium]OUW99866.1 MAG: hypothetical protein CBD91_08080 [Phycisphaeraceae bacterium TMED231]